MCLGIVRVDFIVSLSVELQEENLTVEASRLTTVAFWKRQKVSLFLAGEIRPSACEDYIG